MEQPTQNRIPVDGSWVTVDVYGETDGPAIVMIPGVMSDSAAWKDVAERLESWPTVVVINRRGRRPSGPLTPQYSLEAEVADAAAVLHGFSDIRMLFGWSYGGLIALHLANEVDLPHVVAYEPVMAPFGGGALPDLRSASRADDVDGIVEVALRQVTGMDEAVLHALRGDTETWAELCRLGAPAYEETRAINTAPLPAELAGRAGQVDLIVGGRNIGAAPYGNTFDDVAQRVGRARVHELTEQGHLAHLEAPVRLAAMLDGLARTAASRA